MTAHHENLTDIIGIGILSIVSIHFISLAEAEILIKIALQCIVAGATVYKMLKKDSDKKDDEEANE